MTNIFSLDYKRLTEETRIVETPSGVLTKPINNNYETEIQR